jgi:hypothetical protein
VNETAVRGVIYSTRAVIGKEPSEALVLMCSDRHFQEAFREFLSGYLALSSWDAISAPGGAYMLSFADVLPKQLKVGMRMMKFVMQASAPTRIIVISHEGCTRYLEGFHSQLTRVGFSLKDKQRRDLESVARDLRDAFPSATVEAYYAGLGAAGAIDFERL